MDKVTLLIVPVSELKRLHTFKIKSAIIKINNLYQLNGDPITLTVVRALTDDRETNRIRQYF